MWSQLESSFDLIPWSTSCATDLVSLLRQGYWPFKPSSQSLVVSSPVQPLEGWVKLPGDTATTWLRAVPRRRGLCAPGSQHSQLLDVLAQYRCPNRAPTMSSRHVFWRSQWLSFTLGTQILQFWGISFNYFVDNIIFSGTIFIKMLELLKLFFDIFLPVLSYFPFFSSICSFIFRSFFLFVILFLISEISSLDCVLILFHILFVAISSFSEDINNRDFFFLGFFAFTVSVSKLFSFVYHPPPNLL